MSSVSPLALIAYRAIKNFLKGDPGAIKGRKYGETRSPLTARVCAIGLMSYLLSSELAQLLEYVLNEFLDSYSLFCLHLVCDPRQSRFLLILRSENQSKLVPTREEIDRDRYQNQKFLQPYHQKYNGRHSRPDMQY